MPTRFYFYLTARIFGALAASMLSVAIGWHLYKASGDPFDLALVGLMQILPMFALFILTGWVVDHFPRKPLLLGCAFTEVVVYAGLAFTLNSGELNRFAVFGLLLLHGAARAFYSPVSQAVLPNIVPKMQLSRAVAMVSAAWTSAETIGPFAAGLAIAVLDFGVYYLLVALGLACALTFSALPRITTGRLMRRDGRSLLGGVRYVLASPIVLPSISLDLFIVLLGSVTALLPVYALDVLNVGPEELGLLRAMPALGGALMGMLIAWLPPTRRAGRQLFIALGVFALSILVFAVSRSLWLSLAALLVYGASDMISVHLRSTLIQIATPDALRGRVSAVNSLFIGASNQLGDFRAGSVAAVFGPVPTVLLGGAMAVAVAAIGAMLCPTLRRLDRLTDAAVEETNGEA
jgi:MFS family permease